MGTPYTESLSSYLCRLAQEHCVTSGKLILGEIAPQMMCEEYNSTLIKQNTSILFSNSDAKPVINGMKAKTQSLVQALEELTQRKDLKFLSLLTWKGVINERGLFRQYRAWCPQCNEQWRQENKVIYELFKNLLKMLQQEVNQSQIAQVIRTRMAMVQPLSNHRQRVGVFMDG